MAKAIVDKQKYFFDKGLKHIYIMTMKEIPQKLGMHESTVSRATTAKYKKKIGLNNSRNRKA
ncbi:RNA polymerase factor sigma-54 [Halanaerobium saccharolyticum]|uniref:RNA polymerase factor sigma-54 n=1 Tax=Halanaerobium saccharolyticum TaxID=43595 RepID=UPI000DB90425